MSREKELEALLGMAMNFIGYAECCGNKCRLPHCISCEGDDAYTESGIEDFEERARVVLDVK